MAKAIARICDMREGKALQLFVEDDGDVIVSVIPEGGIYAKGVQFCASGTQSRRTVQALHELFEAMAEDEEAIPQGAGMKVEED
ncbi:hypothetical protein [Marinobacter sp. MIT932201]|uniref:hypothetical protein n=1 Tax=Marinobacter sp. MIT932201 TaxID=3096995 RepID=UPI00399B94B6